MNREELISIFSDTYKDLYGFRPHLSDLAKLSEKELLDKVEDLQDRLEKMLEWERSFDEHNPNYEELYQQKIDAERDELKKKEEMLMAMPSAEEAELEKLPKQVSFKKLVKEEITKALLENKNIKMAILESRLSLINEMIDLDEASFIDNARKWLKNKFALGDQAARDYYRDQVLVNPKRLTSDPASVEKNLKSSLSSAQKEVLAFRAGTLKTSTQINNLQEKIFDLFGKFFNLLDSLPQEKRGLYEREVMKVVAVFYKILMEERDRLEVYLSALAREVSQQGYNLGKSAQDMASYVPERTAQVKGSRVVEPEMDSQPNNAASPIRV